MYPWKGNVARKKWEFLQEQGYLAEHTSRVGLSFMKRSTGVRGFIDWWGKVTWEDWVDE